MYLQNNGNDGVFDVTVIASGERCVYTVLVLTIKF